MNAPHSTQQFFALTVAAVAAACDAKSGTIPNRLTLAAMVVALVGRAALDGGTGVRDAAFGLLVTACVPVVVFLATHGRGLGGGDVKVFAALGASLGPVPGLEVLMASLLGALPFGLLGRPRPVRLGPFVLFGVSVAWLVRETLP